MSGEEEKVRVLAELKEYLEERIGELRRELERLEKLVELVDEELAAKSFRKPVLPPEAKKEVEVKPVPRPPEHEVGRVRVLRSRAGENLATVTVSPNELRFTINPSITVTADMKPFSSFLVKKVLEAMSKTDAERIEKGKLPPGQELAYHIVYNGDRVKEIVVRNFREEYRLREIVNAVRWTLETIAGK